MVALFFISDILFQTDYPASNRKDNQKNSE